MKRILALVLASVLTLTALSALAEGAPSKTVEDLLVVEVVDRSDVVVIVVETENELMDEAQKALQKVVDDFLETLQVAVEENTSIAEVLPEAAIAALPEAAVVTTVTEVVPLKVVKTAGETENDEDEIVIVNMKLATDFTGKEFFVLLAIVAPDGIDDWRHVPAVALEDGSVNVELNKKTLDWLSDNEFLAMFLV